jgi:hypothetical protein
VLELSTNYMLVKYSCFYASLIFLPDCPAVKHVLLADVPPATALLEGVPTEDADLLSAAGRRLAVGCRRCAAGLPA